MCRLQLLLKSAVAQKLHLPSDRTSLSLWTRPVPKACIQSFSLSAQSSVLACVELNLITPEGREILDFLTFLPHIYAFLIIGEKRLHCSLQGVFTSIAFSRTRGASSSVSGKSTISAALRTVKKCNVLDKIHKNLHVFHFPKFRYFQASILPEGFDSFKPLGAEVRLNLAN